MCIAVYKPEGVKMPTKDTLKTCFENNNDGAGFMVASGGKVHISKGYTTFSKFYKALREAMKKYGDAVPYVLHFRITTQAGVRKDCTHPFPLSEKMSDMRLLRCACDIGIAHNGIISLTTSYSNTIDYSDTMAFITQYLSLIITSKTYYKANKKLLLIDRLISGSRLAILDGDGHCELIGNGWQQSGGVWYSNGSYKPYTIKHFAGSPWKQYGVYDFSNINDQDDDQDDEKDDFAYYWDEFMNDVGEYDFTNDCCPVELHCDYSYCRSCKNKHDCPLINDEAKGGGLCD